MEALADTDQATIHISAWRPEDDIAEQPTIALVAPSAEQLAAWAGAYASQQYWANHHPGIWEGPETW